MIYPTNKNKDSVIDEVLKIARERLAGDQVDEISLFIQEYFRQVDLEDIEEHVIADLYGAALSHFNFAKHFISGSPKVRIYNPKLDENGWKSDHTIIEIVNDDMPFLVDSLTVEVNRQGYTQHLIIHPIFFTQRDASGNLQKINYAEANKSQESFIHIAVDRQTAPEKLQTLKDGIISVLSDVRAAVEDWRQMATKMKEIHDELFSPPASLSKEEVEEGQAFLNWLSEKHFTFLGFRDYMLVNRDGADMLHIVPNSGLGILREPRGGISASFTELPPTLRNSVRKPNLLIITKANTRSTVHRPGYLDYVGIKRFNEQGEVIGERRFIGLYTSTAYSQTPTDIPILRKKIEHVMGQAKFPHGSHSNKNLLTILETYPRDELFQIAEQELIDITLGILHLGDRQRTRVFVRRDIFGRFYTCLIYVPRDRYNTELRIKVQEILKRAFNGTQVDFSPSLSDFPLARIFMVVHTRPADDASIDMRALEQEIINAMRRWEDDFQFSLNDEMGEEASTRIHREYTQAFPAAYREEVSPRLAVHDILSLENLSLEKPIALSLYHLLEDPLDHLRFRLFVRGKSVPLSESMPMLEHMGVKVQEERSYAIEPEGKEQSFIHDFGMVHNIENLGLVSVKENFEDTFAKAWHGEIENDDFNRLVLLAGLSAREVVVLRAYCKYLKQTGFTFSQSYIEHTLASHAPIANKLVELFIKRFELNADEKRDERVNDLENEIKAALEKVTNLDEDRILRRFLAVIKATLRTNYFQKDKNGKAKSYLSFKLDSKQVPELPEPRPMFEVYVYSPRVEGIHLRSSKVARGGLRWSDRMEDFRTEVLGLMKAQVVKNVVIVPSGSKGGFVVKHPPVNGDRDAVLKEGIACYQIFLRGLLDLTDNLVSGKVAPPKDIIRFDADDPYLVVAADKGTAAFSDIANAISAEYGFWLGDAFASGGSVGYDHKKMGITARGAWESVKRHFRELNVDIQKTDFTVVGIGDMSGDVFGNGMLLSKHICLIAAFDHRHIFLDPSPNAAISFEERNRLFNLPRSSWADYEASKISKGGGVFPRSAKSISLTPEVKAALSINKDVLTPAELINEILKAPVDLIYNGGIGTYVKASSQSHVDVGDKANDAIRVNGKELRCKVVAEGGNLGFTQLGRIEYALNDGHINTDAIDNSAGVDCSDHEVNIKILLDGIVENGDMTEKQRNKLLADMTNDVGKLVLSDNYYQPQSLSISELNAHRLLDSQARLMRSLESTGRLNRAVEFLPSDEVIAERRAKGLGLTRPENAVLLAYSKIVLNDELANSELVDDEYMSSMLIGYFPSDLQKSYQDAIRKHPLRKEITATAISNSVINRVGATFVHYVQEDSGAASWEITRSFILTRDVFDLNALWKAIEQLDNAISAKMQLQMFLEIGRLVMRGTLWFLRRRREKFPIAEVLNIFMPEIKKVAHQLKDLLAPSDLDALNESEKQFIESGVPSDLAAHIACLDGLYSALDIIEISKETQRSIEVVAKIYFFLIGQLDLRWLYNKINQLPTDTHWQTLARAALRDDLANQQRELATSVLKLNPADNDVESLLSHWESFYGPAIKRTREVIADLKATGQMDLAMLSVGLRELRSLV